MDKFFYKSGLIVLLDDLFKINRTLLHDDKLTKEQQTLLIELVNIHQKLFHLNNIK